MDKIEKPMFNFKKIAEPLVVKEIKNLNFKKTSQFKDITKKLIKEFSYIYLQQ